MAAVFTGTGLGLFNSSLTQLGGASGGSGGVSQGGERYSVNLATGNLVLQDIDESILTRGLPIAFLRTYNSRGLVTEAGRITQIGQDGWVNVFERKVAGLTGTVNTAGSTVTRTLGDGSEVVYAWDTSRSAYVSTVGEGAHDTIVWNATNSRWTWTEGSSRDQEVYDASGTNGGRLMTILNAKSGAQYNVAYTATGPSGLVSTVYSSLTTGDGFSFTYTSGRLTRVSTREGGTTRGQVDYAYDTLNRLISVTTDLTPMLTTDNTWNATVGTTANNGKLFRTTYTYESPTDASNLRISQVSYSDGTLLSFGYDVSGRVIRTTVGDVNGNDADGLGQTTVYTYGATVGGLTSVTVADASGRAWAYRFDATTKELKQIESPAMNGVSDVTTYSYDPSGNGNLLQATTSRGAATLAQVTYTYDARGNALSEVDLLGNRIDRTWSATDQLLTETRYTTPNPNTASTNYQPTTRYVYDTANRLRFVVNAQGEVSEYQYGTSAGANGQVTMMRRFVGAIYDVATTNNNVAPSLTTMTGWTSGKLAQTERTDYLYDAMGRLSETRAFSQVAQAVATGVAIGDGVLDAATEITRYTYDAQGLLRQRIVDRGTTRALGGAAAAGDEVTDYLYDGMGRLLSVLQRDFGTAAMPDPRDPANATAYANWVAANDATTVLTQYVYTDSGNRIVVTRDSGMVRTEVRNGNGQVIAVTEQVAAGNTTGQRVTNRKYDAAGRLVAEESLIEGTTDVARVYFIYDAKGRLSATVDATGAVVETVYDGMDRGVEIRRYANRVTPHTNWWTGTPPAVLWRSDAGTPPANALVVTTDATRDQVTQKSYDAAGRLSSETVVGADAGQTQVTTYTYDGAHRLVQVRTTDGAGTASTERAMRYVYDKVGRPVATVDAENYVTETVYDFAGRVVKKIRYADASANPASSDLALLRPAVGAPNAAQNQTTRYFYDGRGNQVGMLETLSNTEGYLTEFVYDEAQNQRAVKAYAKRLTGLAGNETFAALKTAATTGAPVEAFRLTQRSFNSLGQLTTETNHEGTVTTYVYDEAGRLVKTSTGNVAAEIRDGHLRYDVFGNLTGELSGEGAALVTVGMSQTQIDALYEQYGMRHSYDLLGRRTESIDAAGNKTWYYYDAAGRQTFVVRGVHDAGNVQNAQGEVTETRYDAFGQVLDSLTWSGRIAIAVPGTRSSVDQVVAQLTAIASTESRTRFAYDRRGLLAQTTDAEGYRTTYAYDAFGGLSTVRTWSASDTLVKKTSYVHDRRGLALSATEANAESGATLTRTTATTYDAFGRATTLTDGRGTVTTLDYDRLGRMVLQSRDLGGGRIEAVSTSYDAYSRVTMQTDALGKATTYAYSDTDRAMTVTTPEGVAITTSHNRFGQTVEVRQPLPDGGTATTVTAYDRNGDVASVTDALGRATTQAYDARGLLTSSTDATGRTIAYEYDAAGRVLKRREDPNGLNLTTTYAYDGQGRQVRVTDASGRITTMAYDRKGNLVETVKDPTGLALKTRYTWDRDGRQLTVREGVNGSDEALRTTQYAYDALGRRIGETVAPGSLNPTTTTYQYDANDNVTSRTDASGRITRYAYDAANRLRFTVDGAGGVTEVAYDLAGRATMTRVYARAANLTGLSAAPTEAEVSTLATGQSLANDALDETSYRLYDGDGRVRLSVDGVGGVGETVYDTAGRTIRTTRYAQAVALPTTLRDALKAGTATVAGVGAATSATDESVRYVYDAAGRMVYRIDGAGAIVETQYDSAGRVVLTRAYARKADVGTLPSPSAISDVANLIATQSLKDDAADSVSRAVYDGAGRVIYRIDGTGAIVETRYDAAGRVLAARAYARKADVSGLSSTPTVADLASLIATQSLRNDAADAASYTIYDGAGQAALMVDGSGGVQRVGYDGAGRERARTMFAVPVAWTSALRDGLAAGTATAQDVLSLTVADVVRDMVTRVVYDGAGRVAYRLDAAGGYTRFTYDGAGRVLATRRSAQAIDPATVGAETTVAMLDAAVAATAQDQVEYRTYDAAGRVRRIVDATGAVIEQAFDGAGRTLTVRAYAGFIDLSVSLVQKLEAGVADEADFADFMGIHAPGARESRTVHDAAGRVRYALTRVADDRAIVAETRYDAIGRAIADLRYGVDIAYAANQTGEQVAAALDTALSLDPAIRATQIRKTTHVHDASGQERFLVDATNAVIERRYDALGRAVETRAYGNRPGTRLEDAAALSAWATSQPAAVVRTTRDIYDAAGRLANRIDALEHGETYTYDAIGRMVSYTNRNGDAWQYAYDAGGRRVTETSPQVSVTRIDAAGEPVIETRAIVTRMEYDALGQMIRRTEDADGGAARTTEYAYDNRGHQIRMLLPDAGIVDAATAQIHDSGLRGVVESVYDALGQLVVQRDARGYYSYNVHDAAGRLAYQVDQEGYVTRYAYNAHGEQILLIRHAVKLDTQGPAFTGGGWQPGAAMQALQMEAGIIPSTADRGITTVYDLRGQKSLVRESTVEYYDVDAAGSTGQSPRQGAKTKLFVYDAYGQLAMELMPVVDGDFSDARNRRTFHYYDAIGRETLTVGAGDYVTETRYSAHGEVVETREYATPLPALWWQAGTTLPSVSGLGSVPAQPSPVLASDPYAHGYDRISLHSYDAIGRRVTETVRRHQHDRNGVESVRDVLSEFAYDNEGRSILTRVDGVATQTAYDAIGRVVSIREAERSVLRADAEAQLSNRSLDLSSAALFERSSPFTRTDYDAFGQIVSVRRYANGWREGDVAPQQSVDDQIVLTQYDRNGRVVWERNGVGATQRRFYDLGGNALEVRYRLDGNDGRHAQVSTQAQYDGLGRQITSGVSRALFVDGMPVLGDGGVPVVENDARSSVRYNAFGEIVAKDNRIEGAFAADHDYARYEYDNAGRVSRSNAEGGIWREYGYALTGELVRESHRIRIGGSTEGVTHADAVTWFSVDTLGRTIVRKQPADLDADPVTGLTPATTVSSSYDRWGNVLQSVDGRGAATRYRYNELGLRIWEQAPLVRAVNAQGAASTVAPEQHWFYDALGRQIGTRDANGHIRRIDYDTVGQAVASEDALQKRTLMAYDALGQQRLMQDPIGHITWKTYDRVGRVVGIGDHLTDGGMTTRTRKSQSQFVLNQNGDRLRVVDALGNAVQYDYDSRGLLLRSRTAAGVETTYGYDSLGNKVRETNGLSTAGGQRRVAPDDGEGQAVYFDELTWRYDEFGRVVDHNDLGGADYDYTYDTLTGHQTETRVRWNALLRDGLMSSPAQWLWNQTQWSEYGLDDVLVDIDLATNTTDTESSREVVRYLGGQIKEIREGDNWTRFAYDANGNRTMEETLTHDADGKVVHLRTTVVYDSHNRIERVAQDDMGAQRRLLELRYDYDAVGNRRRIASRTDYDPAGTPIVAADNKAPELRNPIQAPLSTGVVGRWWWELKLPQDMFVDPEGGVLSYAVTMADGSALPSWMQYDAVNRKLKGTPPAAGNLSLRVTATDLDGAATSQDFVLTIYERNDTFESNPPAAPIRLMIGSNYYSYTPVHSFTALPQNIVTSKVGSSLSFTLHKPDGTYANNGIGVGYAGGDGVLKLWADATYYSPTQGGWVTHQPSTLQLVLRASSSDGLEYDVPITIDLDTPDPLQTGDGIPELTVHAGTAWEFVVPDNAIRDPEGKGIQYYVQTAPGSTWPNWLWSGSDSRGQTRLYGTPPASMTTAQVHDFIVTGTSMGRTSTTTMRIRVLPTAADFEAGGTNWEPGAGWSIVNNGDAYTGTWSAQYDGGQTPSLIRYAHPLSVVPGQVVTASVQVQQGASSAGDAAGAILVEWFDASGNRIGESRGNVVDSGSGGAWHLSQVVATAPTGAAKFRIAGWAWKNTNDSLWLDDFRWSLSAPPAPPVPIQANATSPFNMGFEDGTVGWTPGEGWTIKAQAAGGDAHTGLMTAEFGLLSIDGPGPSTQVRRILNNARIAVAPGATVNASVMVQQGASDKGKAGAQVLVVWFDRYGKEIGTSQGNLVKTGSGGQWGQSLVNARAPEGAAFMTIGAQGYTYQSPLWVDDFTFYLNQGTATFGAAGVPEKSYWFAYDANDQVTVANGTVQNSQIVVGIDDSSYGLSYDDAGRAILRTFYRNGEIAVQRTRYDERGQRTSLDKPQAIGASGGTVEETYAYDDAGRMTHRRQWDATGLKHLQITAYDADGRQTLQREFGRSLNGSGYGESPDAEGLATIAKTEMHGYDAAGRLSGYTFHNIRREVGGDDTAETWYANRYVYAYEARESYLERSVHGQSTHPDLKAGSSQSTYDAWGRRMRVFERSPHKLVDARTRLFAYDLEGNILQRQETDSPQQTYAYVDGQRVARGDSVDRSDVLTSPTARKTERHIDRTVPREARAFGLPAALDARMGEGTDLTSTLTGYASGSMTTTVQTGDTLRSIAQRVYGNGSLWYVLAEANGVIADAELRTGMSLKAPQVDVNRNDATTFKPYNPNEIVGDTTPTLPYIPPQPKSGMSWAAMLVRIIVIVIAAVFQQWWVIPLAMAGEAGAQTIEINQGYRQDYNYGAIAMAGVSAAVGVSGVQFGGNAVTHAMSMSAINYAGSYAVNKALGREDSFSLRQMAAGVASAAVTSQIGGGAKDATQQAIRSSAQNWGQVAAEAFKVGAKEVGWSIVRSGVSHGINKAFGNEAHWRWDQVLASAAQDAAGAAPRQVLAGRASVKAYRQMQSASVLQGAQANTISSVMQSSLLDWFGPSSETRRDMWGRPIGVSGLPVVDMIGTASDESGQDQVAAIEDRLVTVKKGDTLSRIAGTSDPATIGMLVAINDLHGSRIRPGRELLVGDLSAYSPEQVAEFEAIGRAVLKQDNARLRALAEARARAAEEAKRRAAAADHAILSKMIDADIRQLLGDEASRRTGRLLDIYAKREREARLAIDPRDQTKNEPILFQISKNEPDAKGYITLYDTINLNETGDWGVFGRWTRKIDRVHRGDGVYDSPEEWTAIAQSKLQYMLDRDGAGVRWHNRAEANRVLFRREAEIGRSGRAWLAIGPYVAGELNFQQTIEPTKKEVLSLNKTAASGAVLAAQFGYEDTSDWRYMSGTISFVAQPELGSVGYERKAGAKQPWRGGGDSGKIKESKPRVGLTPSDEFFSEGGFGRGGGLFGFHARWNIDVNFKYDVILRDLRNAVEPVLPESWERALLSPPVLTPPVLPAKPPVAPKKGP